MDFASLWWAAQKGGAGDVYKVVIRASNNGTAANENILISDLFTVEQWTEDKPKIVEIEAGAIVGGTGGSIAMRTGTGRVGTLTIDNYGSIEGQGGAANGGSGYVALQANQASILNNYNTGFIGGGGGGGGQGGQGGKGGNYTYESCQTGQTCRGMPSRKLPSIRTGGWDCCGVCGAGWICYQAAYCSGCVCSCCVTQTCSNKTNVGTDGGAGGDGGVGQGYNQSPAGTGADGVAGANPPNGAGRGGTGGRGGDGGAWASAGYEGASGATGANGQTTNGSAGSAGSAGGSGAVSIENAQLLTITNDGTIAGEYQYTATIFSANNDTGTNENVNVMNLFTSAQWSSSLPKIVEIEENAIIGGTGSSVALTIPNSGGGAVAINHRGDIQAHGGGANGGAGGTAISVQKATILNIYEGAFVRGGGGGGGKGGTGGTGGGGSYTSNQNIGRAPTGNNGDCPAGNGYLDYDFWPSEYSKSYWAQQTCRKYYSSVSNAECSSISTEEGFFACLKCNNCYKPNGTTTNTNGGAGGAGGNGGVGQGYKQSATNGSGGAAGSNGGTNAGKGGTGGTGGNGATWGNAGGNGNTGATGANGNRTNGSAGSGGGNGGSAGISIAGTSLLTLTNNGTLLGNTTT